MATRRPAKGEQHLLAGGVPPPLAQPDYIESRGGDQMLEMGSGQPEVAASAQDTAQATIYALARRSVSNGGKHPEPKEQQRYRKVLAQDEPAVVWIINAQEIEHKPSQGITPTYQTEAHPRRQPQAMDGEHKEIQANRIQPFIASQIMARLSRKLDSQPEVGRHPRMIVGQRTTQASKEPPGRPAHCHGIPVRPQ
jgi:hypothetical protein